jgi:hypothetical protein
MSHQVWLVFPDLPVWNTTRGDVPYPGSGSLSAARVIPSVSLKCGAQVFSNVQGPNLYGSRSGRIITMDILKCTP